MAFHQHLPQYLWDQGKDAVCLRDQADLRSGLLEEWKPIPLQCVTMLQLLCLFMVL